MLNLEKGIDPIQGNEINDLDVKIEMSSQCSSDSHIYRGTRTIVIKGLVWRLFIILFGTYKSRLLESSVLHYVFGLPMKQ